jgi:hypothetical protein
VSLADDVAATLPFLRAQAESRMTTTCVATTRAAPVWDEATGSYTPGAPTTVYSGPCRLRMPYAYPQGTEAGDTAWAVDRGILSLPISAASAAVTDGMTIVITANPNDPGLVGVELTVLSGHFQTDATARRLPVQLVTRDAGHS